MIYGNHSGPIWFLWKKRKAVLFISCWTSNDYAVSFEYQWIPGADSRHGSELLCQSHNPPLQVEHPSPSRAVGMALAALITLRNKLCTCYTSIILLVPSNLLLLHDFHAPKKERKQLSKQYRDAGFHQHGPCKSVVTGQKPICQNQHSTTFSNFFHLSIETIFHSWHLCWLFHLVRKLNLRSSSLTVCAL